jgi:Rab-like protein 5
MSVDVKVLVVGPAKSGKTAISNFISDAVPNAENPSQAPCKPTVGCRILEFERQVKRGSGVANVGIELWDVSGDRKYEDVWPAIRHNAIGVIFVHDGDKTNEELENW